MSSRPVFLLGLDGLGLEFLDSPLVTEAAPNLVALLRGANVAPLTSTFPPYTAPAWTSITTAVDPGRHGVFGFTDSAGHPVSDASVAAPRLWDYVGRAGGRSVVVNMPITHPARPIEGVMVSGMPVPLGAPYTAPGTLAAELEADGYVTDIAVREDATDGVDTIDRLADMTRARGRAIARLATREPWDLLVAVFVLPDRLGHPWWKFLVPGHRLFDTKEAERVRVAARSALAALDDAVSEVVATLPAGTAVVACSDHGFGALRADLFVDVALADAGFMHRPAARTTLARLGRSRLATKLPAALRRAGRDALAATDADSRARSATPYECGVRVGDPADVAAVTDVLRALRDPNGAPMVAAVHRREDLFHGDFVERAPELLVELADESVDLHDGLHAAHVWVSRDDVAWGTHRVEGVVAVRGHTMVRPGSAADVAATALELLGLAVDGLDGASLVASDTPRRTVTADVAASPAAAYTEDEEAAVFEHLRGLGYVD